METEVNDHGCVARPLNEVWWNRGRMNLLPPDDVPLLAPYQETHPGFELLVADACEPWASAYFARVGGHFKVCLWNIWEQEKDPADSDEEKRRINEMQQQLGVLHDDARYIRLQIAVLQRCWWTFPANVDLILDGISTDRVNLDTGVSCEPPWAELMGVLRHRRGHPGTYGISYHWRYHEAATAYDPLHAPRQELARTYMLILTWWSSCGDLECLKRELPEHADLAESIYRRLGPPTTLKRLYVEKVRTAIAWEAFPYPTEWFPPDQDFRDLLEVYDTAIRQHIGDQEDVVGQMIRLEDLCHHARFRHIDRQIASIGMGQVAHLPSEGEERQRIHRAVTDYVHVLGSWLAGRTLEETISIWPPSEETARRLWAVLEEPTPRKRWLVACLWKRLSENYAKLGRGAIDEQPERFRLPFDALKV